MKLPKTNTEQDTRDYNLPLYGQTGEYSLSANVKVPYFISLIDLKRVTQELKTHEEVSPSLDNKYNLVELFQRNIDPERVRKDIVEGYLKNPNKLKFFNSLTIVLLPKDRTGKTQIDFTDYENNNPNIPYQIGNEFDEFFNNDDAERQIFGGVQFVKTQAASLSRLRWDSRTVDAVAVDGQHRLKALKIWMEQNNNELGETARSTRIPIIFLLLHENAGFKSATPSHSAIKTIAREIFTDLNKNAREVDLATQIILDDRSLSSCCVRSLITESTCQDDDILLPLSLLRWQDANNRFDQKYYLNSLVNLHLIVEDLLNLNPPIKDPMDKSKATAYLRSVVTQLGKPQDDGSKNIVADGTGLLEFYQSKFIDEDSGDAKTPLTSIPVQFLDEAVEGFKINYSGWILKLLRNFKPYRELIKYARDSDLIEGDFAKFLAQPREHREQLETDLYATHGENWEEKIITTHSKYIEKLKGLRDLENGGEQWAYKTIFQKAYLRLGKTLFFSATDEEKERFGSVGDFIAFMDKMYDDNNLRVNIDLPGHSYTLWTFLAVNYGSAKIKVAATSESKIQAILTLAYYIYRFSEVEGKPLSTEEHEDYTSINNALRMLSTKKATTEWPECYDLYKKVYSEFFKNADIIEGISDPSEIDDSRRKAIAQERIKAVLTQILRSATHDIQI
jgi:hypothetical protein